jgi:hypothetical protein
MKGNARIDTSIDRLTADVSGSDDRCRIVSGTMTLHKIE